MGEDTAITPDEVISEEAIERLKETTRLAKELKYHLEKCREIQENLYLKSIPYFNNKSAAYLKKLDMINLSEERRKDRVDFEEGN